EIFRYCTEVRLGRNSEFGGLHPPLPGHAGGGLRVGSGAAPGAYRVAGLPVRGGCRRGRVPFSAAGPLRGRQAPADRGMAAVFGGRGAPTRFCVGLRAGVRRFSGPHCRPRHQPPPLPPVQSAQAASSRL
ncbi:MAG: hypothetical protein AVDCRST_MAG56-862, partial [uncultured Cytophagales bacterium]